MKTLFIYYADGSRQVIKPTEKFDGNYTSLAAAIAKGRAYTFRTV